MPRFATCKPHNAVVLALSNKVLILAFSFQALEYQMHERKRRLRNGSRTIKLSKVQTLSHEGL
jgi:hypothetical protein